MKILNLLIENQITSVIQQIAKEYTEENKCSLWDINNGMCDGFAMDVIEKMGGYSDNLYELTDDMFFQFYDEDLAKEWGEIIHSETDMMWSKDMLNTFGYPPVDLNNIQNGPSHVWVYYNGKHYDAEAPEGKDKWFELPVFRRYFEEIKNG